ncbi:MAG: hypothetical protein IJY99_01915 [Alphaproteobacteria bacterium]|nr:hypothetical protein [Alphaproteobacteria bacterium]
MRKIAISALSLFIVMPALANARLPVVNIASGGVSARSAFGEDVVSQPQKTRVASATNKPASTRTKKVVARNVVPAKAAPMVDSGAQIMASNDVLAPRRPSNDLWAKNDSALRMPTPNEFSVMRSDSLLPEESLDAQLAKTSARVNAVEKSSAPAMSELDSQIARLVELQRRADESVRTVSSRVIASPIATETVERIEPVKVADARPTKIAANDDSKGITLRRLVVPMESDDVVVRSVEKTKSPLITNVRDDMTKMSPSELRRAFRKTFLSENKHLSTFQIDDRFDVASDMSSSIEGFTAKQDLSESGGIRPLEIKIKFRNDDSALSRENYTLLTEYAGIVVNKPTRAIQVAIPQYMTESKDARKLAARRLAIIEQVLTDNGVSQQRVVPVLSQREEPGFVLRIISSDQYETLTQQKRNIFGDTVGKKTYKSMSW